MNAAAASSVSDSRGLVAHQARGAPHNRQGGGPCGFFAPPAARTASGEIERATGSASQATPQFTMPATSSDPLADPPPPIAADPAAAVSESIRRRPR